MTKLNWWNVRQIARLVGAANKVLVAGGTLERLLAIINTLQDEHVRMEAARYIPYDGTPDGVARGVRASHVGKRTFNDANHVTG